MGRRRVSRRTRRLPSLRSRLLQLAKDMKKMNAESGNKFFCAGIDAPEGHLDGLAAAAAAAAKSAPAIGFIFCSHGVEQLAIAVFVPEVEKGSVDASAWIE